MNDRLEMIYGAELLADTWKEYLIRDECPPQLADWVKRLTPAEKLLSAFSHIHIFSCSRVQDDLSQWRAYAGLDGYAVGIDTEKYLISDVTGAKWRKGAFFLGMSWVKVIYGNRLQKLTARKFVEDCIDKFKNRDDTFTEQSFSAIQLFYVSGVKTPHFRSEAEVRCLVYSVNAEPPTTQIGKRHRSYIPLRGTTGHTTQNTFTKLPIVSISLGPEASTSQETSLREILDAHGYENVTIGHSKIPWRS